MAYGLQLKSTKCHLFHSSVPFQGHIVGRRGLECDPRKIEDVKSWPVPDWLKSVCRLLPTIYSKFCRYRDTLAGIDGKGRHVRRGTTLFDSFLQIEGCMTAM